MKKLLLFVGAIFFIAESYSQATFNTGALEVNVNAYGRLRLFTPNAVRHLQRASILVGTSPTTVFDYTNDAEELEPTVLVANPVLSDYEIYGAYDNSYSGDPPAVIVRLNAYGWENGGYTIVKYNVQNDENSSINAMIGLDIIPEINQEYGYDTVTYNAEAGVIRFHRGGQVNMGIKLLSHPLTSLFSFEWYDGYAVDGDYWDWMNYGSLQPQYVSNTADGPVTITSQAALSISPEQSVDVYYALALGADEQAMLDNINEATDIYQGWFLGYGNHFASGDEPVLGRNFPNPFQERTTISYRLPDNGFVSLTICDVTGRVVAELVNGRQAAGEHCVVLKGTELPGGLYFCTLRWNDTVKTMKMNKCN